MNGSSAPAKEEEEPMDVTAAHTENYQTLIDAGLPQKVAESLDNIFQTGGYNNDTVIIQKSPGAVEYQLTSSLWTFRTALALFFVFVLRK